MRTRGNEAAATDGRATLLDSVTEREWQAQVELWALRGGWKFFHAWQSLHSVSGYPDLCLVRGGRLIFAELKRNKGQLSAAQRGWLDDLRLVPGIECYCWRPSDEDAVRAVLEGA